MSKRRPTVRDFNDIDTYSAEVRKVYRTIGKRPSLWLSEFTIQSSESSGAFDFYTTKQGQAQWLRRAYEIVDRLPYVAGMGWFSLVDQTEERQGTWGLLNAGGGRKPSFKAYQEAPSRRYAGSALVPKTVSRGGLEGGIEIASTPVLAGTVRATLYDEQGEKVAEAAATGKAQTPTLIRLRARVDPGNYQLAVRSKRAESLISKLRVTP